MIRTRVALHVHGDNLYFGHGALTTLLGHETTTGLMAMAVTGRRPSEEERRVLDAIAVVMCSADPRIWPLKATRLVSSFGGTLAGFAAGQLAMEGRQIGPWIIGYAAGELVALLDAMGEQVDDPVVVERAIADRLKSGERIAGYGVPLRDRDERMVALRGHAVMLGIDRRKYWRVQEALSAALIASGRAAPNVGVGVAAVLLDLGYTPLQASAATTFLNQNVFAANAFEAAQQRDASMQRLADDTVTYVGPARRSSPRLRNVKDER